MPVRVAYTTASSNFFEMLLSVRLRCVAAPSSCTGSTVFLGVQPEVEYSDLLIYTQAWHLGSSLLVFYACFPNSREIPLPLAVRNFKPRPLATSS